MDEDNWDYSMFIEDKPSWEHAPEWANTLGVCTFGLKKGEWQFCANLRPAYFLFIEHRP